MKVINWTEWDMDYDDANESWEEVDDQYDCVAQALRENNYHFDGKYHQNGIYGVPVFDNGKRGQYSFRGWGEIMARAYPDEIDDSNGMGYCQWAWDTPNNALIKYPVGN